jgi:hypothetical protein
MTPTQLRGHGIATCDRLLRADTNYNANRCTPARWTCECGREWVHVCDEAEGCFYTEEKDA